KLDLEEPGERVAELRRLLARQFEEVLRLRVDTERDRGLRLEHETQTPTIDGGRADAVARRAALVGDGDRADLAALEEQRPPAADLAVADPHREGPLHVDAPDAEAHAITASHGASRR